jgi:hypothetical protein
VVGGTESGRTAVHGWSTIESYRVVEICIWYMDTWNDSSWWGLGVPSIIQVQARPPLLTILAWPGSTAGKKTRIQTSKLRSLYQNVVVVLIQPTTPNKCLDTLQMHTLSIRDM